MMQVPKLHQVMPGKKLKYFRGNRYNRSMDKTSQSKYEIYRKQITSKKLNS